MKTLDILINSLLLCLTSLPLIILLLAFGSEPAVPSNPPLDLAQVNEIQQLLIDHDPSQLLASEHQEVRLSESELNALITYIRNSNPNLALLNISSNLIENGVSIAVSIPASILGMHPWLNIALHFKHADGLMTLDGIDLGALNIPAAVLSPIRSAIALRLGQDENFQLAKAFMDSMHFQSITEERMVIMLDWQEENRRQLENQARQVFVSAREAERLVFYHEKLVDIAAAFPAGINRVTLNDMLRPLFLFANLNTAGGTNAIAENRAVFIVLSAYLTDLELSQLTGTEVLLPAPRALDVIIESREDLARHVVSSAAIAASAGATMAEVLSVYKEVHDSRYRTGFSFTDIAANLSGSMLGTLASRSAADAREFQQLMSAIGPESDYMPELGTYDGMTEEEFIERYGSRESEAYRQRLQELTDSIVARPFYQAFSN
jgi:hypothetical protein